MIIAAEVRDAISSVSSVRAEMKKSDGTWVASISLYDDGLHNDGTAGDGIYGNSWETPSGEYEYHVDITASDNQGHNVTYNNAGKFSTQVIYDDFETEPIDLAKWEESGQVREISDGKLRLNIQGYDRKSTIQTYLVNDDTRYYEARVLVERGSYVSEGAVGAASLSGYFYNDSRGSGSGQDYNQHEGDVWLDIRITLDENNLLKARASATRSNNTDTSSETEIFGQEFSTSVAFDAEYTFSIELTDSEIIFKCNNESLTYSMTTPVYAPSETDKRLMSRIYADSGEFGYFKTRFDDVFTSKGGEPYDDFETDTIDPAKWQSVEQIREISDGKLRMGIRGFDEESVTTVHQAGNYTSYLEAKVLIESGSQVSPGATAIGRIGGCFHNETRGPGSGQDYNGYEGDVWVNNYIMLDENNNLKATAVAFRSDDADWSDTTGLFEQDFLMPILFDKEYILSIELSDTGLIFKCNNEVLNFPLTNPIYELYGGGGRVISSRVHADPGESGYIKSQFDDVFVTKLDGTISGHIYQNDGITPVPNLHIYAEDYDTGQKVGSANTDQDGSYAITGLYSGKYRVKACASCSGMQFIDEFYDNVYDYGSAEPISVVAKQDTPGIDFTLEEGGTISGRVTASDGQPIPNVCVGANDALCEKGSWYTTETDENGNYSIPVPQGDYYIDINASCHTPESYSGEWWNSGDGTTDCNEAVSVSAGIGEIVENINFTLEPGGTVSGYVLQADQTPVSGLHLFALNYDRGEWIGGINTNQDGSYTITGLYAGKYRVKTCASCDDLAYADKFYDDTYSRDDAAAVEVFKGNDTPNISFSLEEAGTISGKVTAKDNGIPISDLHLYAEDYDTGTWIAGTNTNQGGSYTITGLYAGKYRIRACASCSELQYVDERYDDTYSYDYATAVEVTKSNDTPNINFNLVRIAPRETIQKAIADGLAWLAGEQNSDGSWGTQYALAKTALAVLSFETHASNSDYASPLDTSYPYHDHVRRGLDYIFSNAYTINISRQPAGNPDQDNNGMGVYFDLPDEEDNHTRCIYYTSIAMMAIAASNASDETVTVPGSPVDGRTYYEVIQDVVDYIAYAQTDTGYGTGGWNYGPVDNDTDRSDQSNSGWVSLGLAYAEENMGIPTPGFVRTNLNQWIDYIQNDVNGDNDDGGSHYNLNDPLDPPVNILRTGNLLQQMAFVGDTSETLRVQDATDYLVRHWQDSNSNPGWRGYSACYHTTYTVMKGLTALGIDTISPVDWSESWWPVYGGEGIDTISSVDWFQDFTDTLLSEQTSQGWWPVSCFDEGERLLSTEWALLTLQKATAEVENPDLAVIVRYMNQTDGDNGMYDIVYTVVNRGNNAAPAGHDIGLMIHDDIIQQTVPVDLSPGAVYGGIFKLTTALADEAEEIMVCADINGEVNELNEDNNCADVNECRVLTPPEDVEARSGTDSITLSWKSSASAYLAGYNVYRSPSDSGPWEKINKAGPVTGENYEDNFNLIPGTEYYYYLTAEDTSGNESNPSDVASAILGQLKLFIPDAKGDKGTQIRLPVNIANADGLDICKADIYVSYDPDVIEPAEIEKAPLTADYGWDENFGTPGLAHAIIADAARETTLYGEGSLFYMLFDVIGNEGETTELEFQASGTDIYECSDLQEPVTLDLSDIGIFKVNKSYILCDLNGDGRVNSADVAILLRIAVGNIIPTEEQMNAGDASGDTHIRSNDAAICLRIAAELPLAPESSDAEPETVRYVSVPENTTILAGNSIWVPVEIDNAASVMGADIIMNYDPSLITASGVRQSSLTSDFDVEFNTDHAGQVRVSLSAGEGNGLPEGSGRLVEVRFTAYLGVPEDSISPLTLAGVRLNDTYSRDFDTSVLQAEVKTDNGTLTVKQDHLRDIILALKVVAGFNPSGISPDTDVNGDGKTGLEEAVYALQVASGLKDGNILSSVIIANGLISTDTTWDRELVKVTGEVTVADDVTLTITPGTHVVFQGHYKLNVRGTLIAEGTPENRITFTAKDPAEGWHGIRFDNNDRTMDDNAPSEIVCCNLQYGNATDGGSITSGNDDAGGAIFVYNFSDLLISDCIISNNRASYAGGGIYCFYSEPTLTNNIIVNNSAADYGGGIYFISSSPTLMNNTISKNIATTGGGICCHDNSGPTLTNTILWENIAGYGGQAALLQNTCDPHFYYCNIQGGRPAFGGIGAGDGYDISRYKNNINIDPLFAVPSYSAGADFDGQSADWTLQAASPCINAGDPTTAADDVSATDMAGNPRIHEGVIDIGAYEYQGR